MDELFQRIREEQDAELQEGTVRDAVEQRLARRTPLPKTADRALSQGLGQRALWASLVAVALLGWGVAGATRWPTHPTPRAPAAEPLAYARTGDGSDAHGFVLGGLHTQLVFTDGSEVSLASGALTRVVALHAHGAEVAVERGHVDVHVVHETDTRWRLLAGPYVVHVTGTRFGLAWDAASARLNVELREGSVRIEGPCLPAPRELAGEGDFEIACPAWAEAVETPDVAAPEEPATIATASRTRAPATASLASADAAEDVTPPDVTPPESDAIAEARRALLAGETGHAETLLRSVRETDPGSDRAALAAFLLGRLCFDAQHDDVAASRWFETYTRERPQGSLVREALGRRIEAEERLGHAQEARSLAAHYLEAFPSGPHAARARRLVE